MAGSRSEMVRLAREQIGAHYVFGAYGNKPGVSRNEDRYTFPDNRGTRVRLRPNSQDPQSAYAAMTVVHSERICPGRFRGRNVTTEHGNLSWPVPEPTDDQRVNGLNSLLYPRPNDVPNGREVWGECCVGKRHFDCLGFINWLVWRVSGTVATFTVAQWKNQSQTGTREIHGFRHNDARTYSLLRPGDILARGNQVVRSANQATAQTHIGIVTGNNEVVHARGRELGVVATRFNAVEWDFAGILHRRIVHRALDRQRA